MHVPGDLLDLILVAAVAAFAVSGYRQGFIIGVMSVAGFLGGAAFGALIAPAIVQNVFSVQAQQSLLAIVIVFAAAVIGQFVASTIGVAMRSHVTLRSAALFDSAGGAVVSGVSVLVIVWAVATTAVHSPFPLVAQQVNDSAVLRAVDRLMPNSARDLFSSFRRVVANGPFPQVFGGLGAEGIVNVPPPDYSVLKAAGLRRDAPSIVKVMGTAPECSKRIEGTGFVYAPQHVITNAHVVAGVTNGPDVYDQAGEQLLAKVVLYDYKTDIAVLYVPGLDLPSLSFTGPAGTGADAVVAGYPHDEPFHAVPARIGGTQEATGPDIYQSSQVTREIYAIRADVEPGNSGGPLLSAGGGVYGVVFAAAVGQPETGYALTAREVSPDAQAGAAATAATASVSTDACA
jgi:S1-C subfamily serine protease